MSNPISKMELDYDNGLPVWIQIKNRLTYLMGTGELVPGDRLPTVRALAVDLDISYNTVNRAYMDLEREGYIAARQGRGSFVKERHDLGADNARQTAIELLIDGMIQGCAQEGMDESDIVAMVQARLAWRKYQSHGRGSRG